MIFLENDGEPTVNFAYPQIFSHPDTVIRTAVPERTFWEKITILHREANRVRGEFPQRYSRHYYDLFQMSRSVVESWAKYEEAVPGTIKLIPPEKSFSELQDDYGRMKNMIYGSVPSFEQIMTGIRELEQEINQL